MIVPTLNEERNITEVIQELKLTGLSNILIIDGNSNDRTVAIAKKLGVTVIHQNGKGKGEALRQAFSHDGLDGNFIVIMDADGSMNPKEIFSLIEALEYGVDLVKGSRFMPGGHSEDMTFTRRIGNNLFVLLTNFLCSTSYTDLCYGFAAFRRDAVERLYPHLRSKNFEIETEIFIKAKKLDLKVVEVPSIELRRKHGKSNLSTFKDGFRILKTIIHEVFA
ncbi:MAG TPA: glycosyltransferase family 2 protein [Candidatus Bathyarchaeia archaeon]|nr:glycosyltransferase family 2 protein [Candidatus Bathyarchaeia archaeon]